MPETIKTDGLDDLHEGVVSGGPDDYAGLDDIYAGLVAAGFTSPPDLLLQVNETVSAYSYCNTLVIYTILLAYRWRNDDGNEATASWRAAENTDASIPANVLVRVRMQVDIVAAINLAFALEYRHKPAGGSFGGWKEVH